MRRTISTITAVLFLVLVLSLPLSATESTQTLPLVTLTTTVNAAAPALIGISITPSNRTINVGASQQFTATGTYSDKTTADVTKTVTWTSGNPAVASITSQGAVTGLAVGTSIITAASIADKISGSTGITVTAAARRLVGIDITPSNPTVNIGASQQLTATGTYSDKTTADVTKTVTWTSGDPAVASTTPQGAVAGLAAGTSIITAASVADKISGSTGITVAAAPAKTTTPNPPPAASTLAGPQFTVTNLSVSNNKAIPGEIVKVSATVRNAGDQAGSYTATLKVDGVVEGSQTTKSLDPGGQEIVDFEFTRNVVASYQLGIGDETVSVTISQGPGGQETVAPDVPGSAAANNESNTGEGFTTGAAAGISWPRIIVPLVLAVVLMYLAVRYFRNHISKSDRTPKQRPTSNSPLVQQLTVESSRYVEAIAELGRLANVPRKTIADRQAVYTAIDGIAGDLKYVGSRRLQIALENATIRRSVEIEIKSMPQSNRGQFIRQLRQEPGSVIRFSGATEALDAIRNGAPTGDELIMSLMFAMLKEALEDRREARASAKSADVEFMAEKMAAIRDKIQELDEARADAEQKFMEAVAEGAVQVALAAWRMAPDEMLPAPLSESPLNTSGAEKCLNLAAQKRSFCRARYPKGDPGVKGVEICDAIYLADIAACLMDTPAGSSGEQKAGSADHRRQSADAIRKMLDQIGEMKRAATS